MTKGQWVAIIAGLLVIAYLMMGKQKRDELSPIESSMATLTQPSHRQLSASTSPTVTPIQADSVAPIENNNALPAPVLNPKEEIQKSSSPEFLHYQVTEDGMAVVDGDIVLGEAGPDQTGAGTASPANLNLWPGGKIPFFIQGDLKNPERVIQAISYFVDSGLQFTPHQGEEDVLVFQMADAGCRSYLGKVGGKQPVWIGPNCGATEIAHEIMHAVGFIHEQNRSDRDNFVRVLWDNITPSAKGNFELFPTDLMKVSGTSSFDYESIMIYQPTAFSKNSQPTLMAVQEGAVISPSRNLSPADHARIQRAYRLR